MRLRFLITPLVTLFFLHQGVLACQCVDPYRTPYEEFDDSAAVFVGVVTGYRDKVIDAANHTVERSFQFKVEETFKGDKLKTRDISTGLTNEICYVGFGPVGSRLVVYASEERDKLVSYLFCRTGLGLSDVHFLRMRLRNVKEPRIYGVIDREKFGRSKLRVQVVAEDSGKKIIVKPDEAGRFAVDELPDGVYLVRIEAPAGQLASSDEEYRLRLGDKVDDFGLPKKSVFLRFPIR